MKKLFETQPAPSTFQTNNISLESIAELGNSGTVHVVTLDFDGEVRTDEIIDVDVLEKRRRDEVLRRRVRPARTMFSQLQSVISQCQMNLQLPNDLKLRYHLRISLT